MVPPAGGGNRPPNQPAPAPGLTLIGKLRVGDALIGGRGACGACVKRASPSFRSQGGVQSQAGVQSPRVAASTTHSLQGAVGEAAATEGGEAKQGPSAFY